MPKRKPLWGALCVVALGASSSLAQDYTQLEKVIITATKEEKPQREIDQSISTILSDDIEFIAPSHPSEILNTTAGVHVNNLSGEGHMTAIRQPITTGGVYLFLEDGLPTRPTGLFNHNGLYEINVPQADRIEVTKGPGSSLYGSDSIGGIINVITKPSPDEKTLSLKPEYGSYGFKRLLTSLGQPINEDHGFRMDINVTDNDGYRDESSYSRYSTTNRFDGFMNDYTTYKTIFSYTHVDQSGVSSLEEEDYNHNPKTNFYHNDVGRRELDALRLSTEFFYEPDENSAYSFTPFFRHNQMKLMPSWMLTYDPNDRDYEFQSYGLLSKYRLNVPQHKTEFITGVDIDYTPSTYKEIQLTANKEGDIYTSTTPTGRTNYDYDANQLSVSPYVHIEKEAMEDLRLIGGLRYDYFHVHYTDNLPSSVTQGSHLRPQSQTRSYQSFSPKLGLVYRLNEDQDLYTNYRHSFRVPSIGQLFRSGSTTHTDELDPVKTDSVEIGLRGKMGETFNYDATLYHMIVRDDIVTFIDGGTRKVTNAGETHHQGIELALSGELTQELSFKTAWSYSKQTYEEYTAVYGFPVTQISYAGNDVGKAPETLGDVSFYYHSTYLPKTEFQAQWEHMGGYYTDETNTHEYKGHDLFNLRVNHTLNKKIQLFAKVMNITDERYSTYTSKQVGSSDPSYRPGEPRRIYVGLSANF